MVQCLQRVVLSHRISPLDVSDWHLGRLEAQLGLVGREGWGCATAWYCLVRKGGVASWAFWLTSSVGKGVQVITGDKLSHLQEQGGDQNKATGKVCFISLPKSIYIRKPSHQYVEIYQLIFLNMAFFSLTLLCLLSINSAFSISLPDLGKWHSLIAGTKLFSIGTFRAWERVVILPAFHS